MGNSSSKKKQKAAPAADAGAAAVQPASQPGGGSMDDGPMFREPTGSVCMLGPPGGAMAGGDDPVPLPSSSASAALPAAVLGENPSAPLPTVESQEVALSFFAREKTFRPQRVVPDNARGGHAARILKTVNATMKATLGAGDLERAVRVPPGEDLNEWLACNVVQFYNAACLIYGTVASECTDQNCPLMSAGAAEYLWKDDTPEYRKPTRVPARKYIDLMLAEIDESITDPDIFPTDEGARFPRNFQQVVRNIFKRLFRLYAHIYCAHHQRIRDIGAAAHLNSTFKHLMLFILEFDLLAKAEMKPLEKLINRITADRAAK